MIQLHSPRRLVYDGLAVRHTNGREDHSMDSITRRKFLRDGALGVAALAAASRSGSRLAADPLGLPIGLELYTVRAEVAKDLPGALKKVAQVGYREVETGGIANQAKAIEFRQAVQDAGLACPSLHFDYDALRLELPDKIEIAKTVGATYMICSNLPDAERSLTGYRKAAEVFNHAGEECLKAGLHIGYHCHNFDFTSFDGVVGFDELLRLTDPQSVGMQMDCFWVTRAGLDPVHYLNTYPGRFPTLHIKDLKPGYAPGTATHDGPTPGNKGGTFTEVGRGVIDWKRIFAAAPRGGLKHYFVEQDFSDDPEFETMKISYDYLHALTV
jgi:sugar phosphate isomerase/epimerase